MISAEQEDRKWPPAQGLLKFHLFIACNERFEGCLFDQGQQPAILDGRPAFVLHGRYVVTGQIARHLLWHAFIEDYLQG